MIRRDDKTLNLFDWTPPKIVKRFDDQRVRAVELRDLISRGVAETLRNCELPRAEIAEKMSSWLGEDVSANMLDQYASPAKDEHVIPLHRALALIHVTGDDVRLLQLMAEMFAHAVIESRYVHAVHEAILTEQMETLARERKHHRKGWKGSVS
ncbi:MAG: DNA transposition protein [Alphaproteobacteria bacterium]|nr:DNA transposition protein [Alphaproteobacteria bacterium]MBF0249927.1 DNA transposition protein [Alphaproteobacteria bacterium]